MGSKSKAIAIAVAGVSVVVIAAVIAVVVVRGGAEDAVGGGPQQVPGMEFEGPAGARIDGDQRSWMDPLWPEIDDRQYATPGQYSTDAVAARPVWTPVDPLGDLPDASAMGAGVVCEEPQLEGRTQQQYVKGRFLVVNESAGPTTMVNAVPGGYAHTVQGAVVAAMNQLGYGLYAQGDEVGEAVDAALWSTSEEAQAERRIKRLDVNGASDMRRAEMVPAAAGFRVVTCSDAAVVVEVAFAGQLEQPPLDIVVSRVPLFWRDGDWVPDFTGAADAQLSQPSVRSLEGFTEVVYQ